MKVARCSFCHNREIVEDSVTDSYCKTCRKNSIQFYITTDERRLHEMARERKKQKEENVIKKTRVRVTPEQLQKILDLSKEGKTNKEIYAIVTDLKRNQIRRVLRQNKVITG